jgi:hypothetical protein
MKRIVTAVAFVTVGLVFGQAGTSYADDKPDLGWFRGTTHFIPPPPCHPHCHEVDGVDYDFDDDFPAGTILDNATAKVDCSGEHGCVFDPSSASVDNVNHKIHLHIRSRSEAVQATATAHIVAVGSH